MATNQRTNTLIESTIICIDNSDYMRNEDIGTNRLESEQNAINMICHHILSLRTENRVGLLTLADNPQIVQSLTNNEVNVMQKLYKIEIKGQIKLTVGIKTALLALKDVTKQNRKNRIIVFIGSPLTEDQKELEGLVEKLLKLKISLDIVNFGSENESQIEFLKSFVNKLKDSHLVIIEKKWEMNNVLATSAILSNNTSVSLVNENTDPELALAMKISTAEHKDQFDMDMKKALEESELESNLQFKADPNSETSKGDQNIQKAIAMSLEFMKQNNIPINDYKLESKTQKQNSGNVSKVMTEEEQLALSLQMSLMQNRNTSKDNSKVEPKVNEKNEPKISNKKKNQPKND